MLRPLSVSSKVVQHILDVRRRDQGWQYLLDWDTVQSGSHGLPGGPFWMEDSCARVTGTILTSQVGLQEAPLEGEVLLGSVL